MITFPHLGFIGRLGNQMFQYATLFSLSKKHKVNISLCRDTVELCRSFNITAPINSFYNNNFISAHNLKDVAFYGHSVHIQTEEQNNKFLTTEFDLEFLNTNHDGKSILGYFQNHNYFSEFESELRKEYRFKKIYENISKFYLKEIFDQEIISLHIRRTDYIGSPILNTLDLKYYGDALSYFDKSLPVLVFSDDPNWCEEQTIFQENRFKIIKTNNTYVDLCLMSKCDYHIIANSTFSWWGSWLAKSKKTICPKQWFLPHCHCLDSEGLRLSHWISI